MRERGHLLTAIQNYTLLVQSVVIIHCLQLLELFGSLVVAAIAPQLAHIM